MTVTVIICTRDRADSLERTLESLAPQMGNPLLAEVVLVDNGSRDMTCDVISAFEKSHPGMVVPVFEPRGGKTYALNSGIAASSSEVLAFTDDDVILPADWVSQIACALKSFPDCRVFGGRVVPVLPQGLEMPAWVHRVDPFNTAEGPLCDHDKGEVVRSYKEGGMCTPVGANCVVLRRIFDSFGYFDSDLETGGKKPMSEDSIFFNRLKRSGVDMLYIPSMQVMHVTDPNRLTKKYFRSYFRRSARSVVRVSRDHERGRRIFNVPRQFLHRLVIKGFLWVMAWFRFESEGLRFARELDFIYLATVVGTFFRAEKEAGS